LKPDEPLEPQSTRRGEFERLYATEREPWTYSERAAEVLRHDFLHKTVSGLRPHYRRILDVGCSVGQLTSRLVGLGPAVQGMDVSPTAVARARERCEAARRGYQDGTPTVFRFCVGSSVDPPFRDDAFDLILMCDGLHSWRLTPEEQARTLERAHRLLAPGGYVVLTDHLKPHHFRVILDRVRASPLEVVSVRYLHNRLWYSLERGLSRFRERQAVRALLASRSVARALGAVSRLAGKRGAKHLCIVARRAPSE
jgi:SAM-dependent methyltransferase